MGKLHHLTESAFFFSGSDPRAPEETKESSRLSLLNMQLLETITADPETAAQDCQRSEC